MDFDDKGLSDVQIHQLNSYEPVQLARTAFLAKAAECIRNPTLELLEERRLAEEHYSAVFVDRLNEVMRYQPVGGK